MTGFFFWSSQKVDPAASHPYSGSKVIVKKGVGMARVEKNASSLDIHQSVRLSDGKIQGIPDLVNLILEYFVFYKWMFFKNRPRGNLLFLRSLLVVGTFSILYFYFFGQFELVLEGIDIDPVIALGLAAGVGYWNMVNVLNKKSMYCGQLYNQIFAVLAGGDKKKGEAMATSLAIQLLTLDLWAHRSFGRVFVKKLDEAIQFHGSAKGSGTKDDIPTLVKKVQAGKLKVKEARTLLEDYQAHLLA